MKEKLLISSLGLHAQEITYTLGSQQVEERFSSVALVQLLRLEGYTSLVFSTRESIDKFSEPIAADFGKLGIPLNCLKFENTNSADDIFAVIEELTNHIPADSEVILDVTAGLRHLPFIYFAALSYLVGLRGVHIRGIYYSAIDGSRNSNTAQFIELTPIFDLIEWYQALQAARDAGCLLQLSDRLEELVTTLFKGGIRDTSLPRAGLKSLSLNIGSVFPLEVGIASSRVCEVLDGIAECYPQNIAGRLALRSLREQLEHWRIAPDETTLGPHIKKELLQNRLSEDELRRQLRLAHWYYDHDNIPAVLLLLREWLVSLVIFAATEGKESWLNTDDTNSVREKWEAFPYHVKARREAGLTISAFEEKLEKTWHEVSSRRNKFAHAGMTIKDISVSEEKVKELLFSCEELLTTCEQLLAMNSRLFWDNNRQSKLLICSLGQSPGVVYSALMHCRPDKLLVVASEQSQHSLQAALEAAEMASIEHRTLCMTDHVGGFNEHKSLIDQSVRQMLGNAREVIGSITGGTTAMQYTVERLIAQAKNFGPTVTTIALLDRRSRVEQQNQPYVLSDIIELETRKCMLEQQMEEVLVLN